MIQRIIRFITHGAEFSDPDWAEWPMTTRWHRVKCKVRFQWYMVIRSRARDWWNNETYVPLFWRAKGEMRSVRWSAAAEELGFGNFHLPLSVPNVEDLPHFKTSDACFDYISETWPHLQP
jgi:hypothetical protein